MLRDRAAAEAYVASVCFKHGPPLLTGVELEWLVRPTSSDRLTASTLAAALGRHCPVALDPSSPADPLPGGSLVTVEPGGQIELASPPLPDLAGLLTTAVADADELHRLIAAAGLAVESRAAAVDRPPQRLLDAPRYRAMEQSFDRIGPHGRSAMCSTAAVQVCVDAGERAAVAARWSAVHALGPGAAGGVRELAAPARAAHRLEVHAVGRLDAGRSRAHRAARRSRPRRTRPRPGRGGCWTRRCCACGATARWLVPEGLTFAAWVRGGEPRPPTIADLDYHVSTLFPPVRPRGHLEVRYVDMQPGRRWALPVAVLTALLSDPGVIDVVRNVCAPARSRWVSAARHGLADRVLAQAAVQVFDLAAARLPDLGAPTWLTDELVAMTERLVRHGLCPADEPEGASL